MKPRGSSERRTIMTTLLRTTLLVSALGLASAVSSIHAQAPASAPARDIIAEVRGLIAKSDFATAESILRAYAKEKGWTPEALEAISWLGRGNLAANRLEVANRIAYETERLALAALEKRPMDAEPRLPIAIGAALEVQAQVLGQQGQR